MPLLKVEASRKRGYFVLLTFKVELDGRGGSYHNVKTDTNIILYITMENSTKVIN